MRLLTFILMALFFGACKNNNNTPSTNNSAGGTAATTDNVAKNPVPSPFVFNDTVLVSLGAKDFAAVLKSKPNMPILDLRSPDMYAKGHVWRSVNMDANARDFLKRLSALGRDQEYAVYDEFGDKSLKVAEEMKKLSFFRIYHLKGGLFTWGQTGVPLQLH